MQQVLYPMAHLPREQLIGFLGLLALGDIKENSEHDPAGDVCIVTLAPCGYPSYVASGQNPKINFVGADHCARGGECRPDPLQIGRVDIL